MRANRQLVIWVGLWIVLAACPGAAQEAGRGSNPVPGRIAIEDFIQLHAFKGALVLDVRGTDAYRAGHIPGAVHLPLDQIAPRAEEIQALVKHRAVVAYCSCPEEHASLAAVRLLDANGVPHASALVGGYPAWVAKGGEIKKSIEPTVATAVTRAFDTKLTKGTKAGPVRRDEWRRRAGGV